MYKLYLIALLPLFVCASGGGSKAGNSQELTEQRDAILKNPVSAVENGDARINRVYAKYLNQNFSELNKIDTSELSPIEKAIILFVQATNANTLEEIESYQTHILSLLNGTLDNITFNNIYYILTMTYHVYMVKLKQTEPNKPEPEMLAMLSLAKTKVLENESVWNSINSSDRKAFDNWTPSVTYS